MDNAPCHNQAVVFSNVKLVQLPPNCPSILQSMDQGVIWSFKYEQRIMKVEVDILMAIHLVKKAWVSVHPHVLINAFMKAGFKSTLIQPVMQPPEDKCDLIEEFTHYVSIDDHPFEEHR
ncbi:unnamed protein product [Echinostoma caproni]|uniref:DDE-1 domain-containing protein n=1 Tax=Echinostoma caproni TaxID=27848 RepID=A0A183AK97_9TREM|nr:unnamed protein product [Echinostoma caproni]